MKTKLNIFSMLLGAMLLALPGAARAQQILYANYYYYTTNNGAATIIQHWSLDSAVTVPGNLNGVPVISIGKGAFWGDWRLTNVTVTNTVANIGDYAFSGCRNLTNITIGRSVTNIGAGASYRCASLRSITVDALNPAYCSVDGVFLFNKSQTALFQCPIGTAGNYAVPDGVTNIGDLAFSHCGGLTGITIPNSVTRIGSNAFACCTSLTSVTIPNNVTIIGSGAFAK
jgi:hypothetical protein